jgi:hypothetical protein
VIARSAEAAAAWHSAWLTALGLRSERDERVWRALDPPPFIYWTAITLDESATAGDLAGSRGTVCDTWSAIDLERHGYTATERDPWFVRPPGPLAQPAPSDLEIVRVETPAEVEEFERTSLRGFADDDERAVEPGSIHPPPILADSRMTMLTGRVDGRAVSAAMSYRVDDMVGIYGVTTLPAARRRGYASALTAALIDPDAHASLSPSAMAEGIYRQLGFERAGELTMWQANEPDPD